MELNWNEVRDSLRAVAVWEPDRGQAGDLPRGRQQEGICSVPSFPVYAPPTLAFGLWEFGELASCLWPNFTEFCKAMQRSAHFEVGTVQKCATLVDIEKQ